MHTLLSYRQMQYITNYKDIPVLLRIIDHPFQHEHPTEQPVAMIHAGRCRQLSVGMLSESIQRNRPIVWLVMIEKRMRQMHLQFAVYARRDSAQHNPDQLVGPVAGAWSPVAGVGATVESHMLPSCTCDTRAASSRCRRAWGAGRRGGPTRRRRRGEVLQTLAALVASRDVLSFRRGPIVIRFGHRPAARLLRLIRGVCLHLDNGAHRLGGRGGAGGRRQP